MNTEDLKGTIKLLDAENEHLKVLEDNLLKLKIYGQERAYVNINGLHFDLSNLDRESGYMSYAVTELNEVRLAAIKFIESRIVNQRLRIELLKNKIRDIVSVEIIA